MTRPRKRASCTIAEEEIFLRPWRTATRGADLETAVKIQAAITKMIESLWGKQD